MKPYHDMQMMDMQNIDSHEKILEGADLMNQTFEHLMDFSDQMMDQCKSKTGHVQDLSTVVFSANCDDV